jgi:hypothetical protein
MQIATPLLTPQPVLSYQRLDARIEVDEPEYLRPEHIEALLGEKLAIKQVAALRQMDIKDAALLDILYRTGEALGAAQLIHRDTRDENNPVRGAAIAPDWPPPHFDLPSWRGAGEAAGAEQAQGTQA